MNMQSIGILVALVVAFLAFKAIASGGAARSEQAHQKVAAGALLVDVRSVEEFAGGHINGAINVPVQDLPAQIAAVGDKARPVVVYCRSGARSARASRILSEHGYTDVTDLGGMGNW